MFPTNEYAPMIGADGGCVGYCTFKFYADKDEKVKPLSLRDDGYPDFEPVLFYGNKHEGVFVMFEEIV